MKNLIASFIVACACVLTSTAADTGLKVGAYKVAGSDKIKVLVESATKTQVTILNHAGKTVSSSTLKGSDGINIDLSTAPAGTYHVVIDNGTESITKEITKGSSVHVM